MYKEKKIEVVNKGASSDEIDLSLIMDRIGYGMKWVLGGIFYVFHVIWKHIVLILLFVALGLGLSYWFYSTKTPYYTSSITLVLADIRNEFIENQLNNLSDLIKENNTSAVSRSLDIGEVEARQIREMRFSNLDQDRIADDSILTGSPFRIELSLYDNMLFEEMEPALTNYLENNPYFSKQKRIRQREIESLIAKLKSQVESIDSVKNTVVTPRGPVNGFVYGEPIDPTNLYRESMSLYQKQVELEAKLEQLDNVQVVNSFTPRSRPTGPKLSKFLVVGGGIGLLAGFFVAFIMESSNKRRIA
ncbi:chain length determinant protein [Pontibacter diazotrophicus]|uniref:Chain length determinant protein n=1 Tax=Pontibacter diazotrophicus TaxID=1400979 RepID=A0A3D8LGB3_9BACT|nr:Wzz/FepE/Etk N-terminal domain-containing protein [Pontibacter diazotrophicus]RDV16445.1 chain length determinant protein [Pontibacter diazotrophicus]